MRKWLGLASMSLALVSCSPQPMTMEQAINSRQVFTPFYKSGGTFSGLDKDKVDCSIEAANRVPASVQIAQTSSYRLPTNTSCYGVGSQAFCNTTGGNVIGGQVYSYDANAGLREQAGLQCLARKGYRQISLPACPKGTAVSDFKSKWGQQMGPLTSTTCYLGSHGQLLAIGSL